MNDIKAKNLFYGAHSSEFHIVPDVLGPSEGRRADRDTGYLPLLLQGAHECEGIKENGL